MIARHLTAALHDALETHPVVFLRGARQTGKTTLALALAAHKPSTRYLTLDDPETLLAATVDPVGFVDGQPGPLIIDEVQRAPSLPLVLKRAVDMERTPGRFLLTGSAQVLVLPALSRELVGRMGILTLRPFSQGELLDRPDDFVDWSFSDNESGPKTGPSSGRSGLVRRALSGGFPEPLSLAGERQRESWFAAYVDTVLQRDVSTMAQIEALSSMPRLLSLLAARSASLLNIAELSRTAGLARSTLDRYLALLSGTFLIDLVPAWSTNLGKRLVKAPKAFMADTGLQAHLLGIDEDRLRRDPHLAGPLLETMVYLELAKQIGWSDVGASINHFRSHSGREVDLVLEDRSGRVVGVEVKASATVGEADLDGLRALASLAGERFHRGVLLYTGDRCLPLGPRLYLAPLDAVWGGDPAAAA